MWILYIYLQIDDPHQIIIVSKFWYIPINETQKATSLRLPSPLDNL